MTPIRAEIPEDVRPLPTWRYFLQWQLREALAHTDAGGIAIHESGQQFMGKPSAHLLAGTKIALMNAAEELGLKARYVQLEPRIHFDLWGTALMEALRKCMEDEEETQP